MGAANAVMNTIQAIQLPFVLIPLARYIKEKTIMKELVFGGFKYWFIIFTAIVLIGLNVWNVLQPFVANGAGSWQIWTFAPLFSLYIGFLIYLIFLKLDTGNFEELHKKVRKFGKSSRCNSKICSPCKSPLRERQSKKVAAYGNTLDVPLIDEVDGNNADFEYEDDLFHSSSSQMTKKSSMNNKSPKKSKNSGVVKVFDKKEENSTHSNSPDNLERN